MGGWWLSEGSWLYFARIYAKWRPFQCGGNVPPVLRQVETHEANERQQGILGVGKRSGREPFVASGSSVALRKWSEPVSGSIALERSGPLRPKVRKCVVERWLFIGLMWYG